MEHADTAHFLRSLLATHPRDEEALYAAHRGLLFANPTAYRRLVSWLVAHADERADHLAVAIALLAVSSEPTHRAIAARLIETVPLEIVIQAIDHVRGWTVERLHVKPSLKRFDDAMTRAYAQKGREVKALLEQEHEDQAGFVGGEVVVTLGQYDKVQQVLDYLEIGYRLVPCKVVGDLALRADQVLIVNCPGQFDARGVEVIERFVRRGGTLVTTDWALKTTIERAFPGRIEHNGVSTRDDVAQVSWVHPDDPITRGVEVEGHPLAWWLEGASYPIRILDRHLVRVLARSDEMGRRYHDDSLVVCFPHGEGVVFHLTSHYYLQRSKADAADQQAAAHSSLKLLANILYDRRRISGC